jgi:hypothetical protein
MAIERERVFSAAKRTKGMLLERELLRRASVSDSGGGLEWSPASRQGLTTIPRVVIEARFVDALVGDTVLSEEAVE